MKKKIALVGFFGFGNFGDELFIELHKQHLADQYDLFVANDIDEAPYFSGPIEDVVDKADAILIGGGDLINPIAKSELYWRSEYLAKPTFVFGLGVPRVSRQNPRIIQFYRDFFQHENCKLVVCRDQESYDWVKKNLDPGDKLHWYPDPVCSMRRPAPKKTDEKILGVVMRHHRSLADDLSAVRTMIDEGKRLGFKIRHLVLGNMRLGKGDYELAKQIAEEDEEIFYSESLEEMCQEIGACTLLASIKFHGCVVATMYGVPSIAMSVTPKNRNFMKMIQRPEMVASYTDPNLYKRLSYYPARVHQMVRGNLFRRSTEGYKLLKASLEENIGK